MYSKHFNQTTGWIISSILLIAVFFGCDTDRVTTPDDVDLSTAETMSMEGTFADVKSDSFSTVSAAPEIDPRKIPAPTDTDIMAYRCYGPDPAAYRINFKIIQRYSRFRGRVRISGIVKNIGMQAFHSDPRQASVCLYEFVLGMRGRVVARRSLEDLAPNTTISLVYYRNWDSSSPAEGEFPPNYVLLIAYDPDILSDGNPQNDDCNYKNNQLERSGSDINDLLR